MPPPVAGCAQQLLGLPTYAKDHCTIRSEDVTLLQRFRQLTTDGRLWLLVSAQAVQRLAGEPLWHSATGRHCAQHFASLREAVAASRPGDTLLLEPGEPHSAQDVQIAWPLRLLGGTLRAEDTMVECVKGATTALDFRYCTFILLGSIACLEKSSIDLLVTEVCIIT